MHNSKYCILTFVHKPMFRFRSQKENERQEKLLLSVLPSFVAQQMIRNSFNDKPSFLWKPYKAKVKRWKVKKQRQSMLQKVYSKLISCLETGWRKKLSLIIEITNLIQLLVSVMSNCWQTFFVDFLEFVKKKRHLKNLKKSANKFIKNKKIIIRIKKG